MSKRGRPARFDRAEALRRAMTVFWEFGYEGASIAQLKAAMGGLCAPSLYAAFGSKEALFREAVELYRTAESPLWLGALDEPTARSAVEAMLRNAATRYAAPGKPRGCLVDLGTNNSAPASQGVREYLRTCRQESAERIGQRLRRGIAEGDLGPQTNVEAVTAFYTTVLQGLSTQASDGATSDRLTGIVDCAMRAWDALVGTFPATGESAHGI